MITTTPTNSELLEQYRANPNKRCLRRCPAGVGHTVGFHIDRLERLVAQGIESRIVTASWRIQPK